MRVYSNVLHYKNFWRQKYPNTICTLTYLCIVYHNYVCPHLLRYQYICHECIACLTTIFFAPRNLHIIFSNYHTKVQRLSPNDKTNQEIHYQIHYITKIFHTSPQNNPFLTPLPFFFSSPFPFFDLTLTPSLHAPLLCYLTHSSSLPPPPPRSIYHSLSSSSSLSLSLSLSLFLPPYSFFPPSLPHFHDLSSSFPPSLPSSLIFSGGA